MEIHHIDGDHTNNDINNLRLVTIDEHYKIHYQQKDWGACYFMMMRMNKTPEEISNECSELQRKLVAEGSHHLLSGEIQRKYQCHLVSEGKLIFQQRSSCLCSFFTYAQTYPHNPNAHTITSHSSMQLYFALLVLQIKME
jgi:hypothetical protein